MYRFSATIRDTDSTLCPTPVLKKRVVEANQQPLHNLHFLGLVDSCSKLLKSSLPLARSNLAPADPKSRMPKPCMPTKPTVAELSRDRQPQRTDADVRPTFSSTVVVAYLEFWAGQVFAKDDGSATSGWQQRVTAHFALTKWQTCGQLKPGSFTDISIFAPCLRL